MSLCFLRLCSLIDAPCTSVQVICFQQMIAFPSLNWLPANCACRGVYTFEINYLDQSSFNASYANVSAESPYSCVEFCRQFFQTAGTRNGSQSKSPVETATAFFKLANKYRPESKQDKKDRLRRRAEERLDILPVRISAVERLPQFRYKLVRFQVD